VLSFTNVLLIFAGKIWSFKLESVQFRISYDGERCRFKMVMQIWQNNQKKVALFCDFMTGASCIPHIDINKAFL